MPGCFKRCAAQCNARAGDKPPRYGRVEPVGAYFRVGNSNRKFVQADRYVGERLALSLSKKRQQSGRRRQDWSLAFFQGDWKRDTVSGPLRLR